jgi:hypothetical protein
MRRNRIYRAFFGALFSLQQLDANRVVRCSRGFLFRLEGQTCFSPGIEAALKGPNILVAALPQFLRQTGAGSFVRSSAVSHGWSIFWNLRQRLVIGVGRHANCARQLFL